MVKSTPVAPPGWRKKQTDGEATTPSRPLSLSFNILIKGSSVSGTARQPTIFAAGERRTSGEERREERKRNSWTDDSSNDTDFIDESEMMLIEAV